MTKWVAGWSMPGCLPEADPGEFDTWYDARDYLASELSLVADQESDTDVPTETYMRACRARRELDPEDTGAHVWHAQENESWLSSEIGGYCYWIMRSG